MAPGVIADQVAGIDQALHQRRLLFGVPAQEEERSRRMMLRKDVNKLRGPGRVWAIVEGKSQFAWAQGSYEGASEDLRARPQRRILKTAGGKAYGRGGAESEGNVSCD
jgi:hypothetical protein